ncbi:helix-turn-helix domain-containing protein [Mucilaginibacter dorajii]|uniref:helix-turn-helix domain-containing protein n=1 Tax=Mucilaginibacter dorajii TaxID=692994 RepID=UPI00216A4952|nr:helix-turn-helix domain-containing protein [Mucilaginibacter dorajii]MCS3736294.1 AraC-like DNA-binding protein [Mucilaginibacter dorajii]
MKTEPAIMLRNPADGELGFRIIHFDDDKHFNEVQRVPCFSIILISEGDGVLKADFTDYQISKGAILFFSPYQPFMIDGAMLKGIIINFHPDFFCIFRHQNEVACDGILFNNPNNPPFFNIPENESHSIYSIIEHITAEMSFAGLAQHDLLIAYLKILLIRAIRIKLLKSTTSLPLDQCPTEAALLRQLNRMIELHFKTKHSVSEYAELLNIPIKTLGRLVKNHFQRTLTEIIAERIIMEAKRELNFTSKTLKEIAYDLGFNDEYHFSRYFKNKIKISPQSFRNSLRNMYDSSPMPVTLPKT